MSRFNPRRSTSAILGCAIACTLYPPANCAEEPPAWARDAVACRDAYDSHDFPNSRRLCTAALSEASAANSPDGVLMSENLLGLIALNSGSPQEAVEHLRHGLDVGPQTHIGPVELARVADNLGLAYLRLDQPREALKIFEKNREIFANANPRDAATTENNYAMALIALGRAEDAFAAYANSISLTDKAFGPGSWEAARVRVNVAELMASTNRRDKAEIYARDALAILKKIAANDPNGSAQLDLAYAHRTLGLLLQEEGRYPQARSELEAAEAIIGRLSPSSGDHAAILGNLGLVLEGQGDLDDAVSRLHQSLSILEALKSDVSAQATVHDNLGRMLSRLGQCAEARAEHAKALALDDASLGRQAADTAVVLANSGQTEIRCGQLPAAAKFYREATTILRDQVLDTSTDITTNTLTRLRSVDSINRQYLDLLYLLWAQAPRPDSAKVEEGFLVSQGIGLSSAGIDAARASARLTTGNSAAAEAIRQYQQNANSIPPLESELAALQSGQVTPENSSRADQIRRQLDEAHRKAQATAQHLEPRYASLARPQAIASADLKSLLQPDEALVTYAFTTQHCYAFVVRPGHEIFAVALKSTPADLASEIQSLRRGLEIYSGRGATAEVISGPGQPTDHTVPVTFDVTLAHKVYSEVWAPVEPSVQGAKHLLVVPVRALLSIPLQVLVTSPPDLATAPDQALQKASWLLLKPYSLGVLPSVYSLKALRTARQAAASGSDFVGFGNPVLDDNSAVVVPVSSVRLDRQGALENVQLLRTLGNLPDTADELKEIAREYPGHASIYLGAAATESKVEDLNRNGQLRSAAVVMFATHALLAGQLAPGAEPGLVLTPPAEAAATAHNDGYLSASEVANLDLSAGFVVLSACNTAAPEGGDDVEGLSGLARAFFFAGARGLLVSHWSVRSSAAVALTTQAFKEMKTGSNVRRSEALQRSAIALLRSGTNPEPAYWAPFSFVGEN